MVGQLLYCLMPSRRLGSVSTSMPLNLTPKWVSTCTTAEEKPHCGNTGVPFMKRTTSFDVTSLLIRSATALSISRYPHQNDRDCEPVKRLSELRSARQER